MKRTTIVIALLLLNLGIYSCTSSQSSPNDSHDSVVVQTGQVAKNVTTGEFDSLIALNNGLLLDVRTPDEFNAGKIAKSENIDFYGSDFQDAISKLDKSKPVYVYCRSGRRSGVAMNLMKEMGFVTVYNLDGGIISWQESGLSVEK